MGTHFLTQESVFFRYSVEFFQPPVKTEPPQKLGSYSSSSSLSNSSQSSGSLNSLDSQSSFSSSCTITAEQEQNFDQIEADVDTEENLPVKAEDIASLPVDCDKPYSDQTGLLSDSGNEINSKDKTASVSTENQTGSDILVEDGNTCTRVDSGFVSLADTASVSSMNTAQSRSTVCAGSKPGSEKEFTSPVRPVLGIQTEDLDRITPMFFIQPVDSEGVGLGGEEGVRLEDKGRVALLVVLCF